MGFKIGFTAETEPEVVEPEVSVVMTEAIEIYNNAANGYDKAVEGCTAESAAAYNAAINTLKADIEANADDAKLLESIIALNLANLKKAVDNSVANAASAGIAAAMTLDENNRVVTARVSVKAKDAKVYRVGMWLIEDKIAAAQNGSSTIKSHDNAVRYVARGADGSADYIGYPINEGKTLNAGQLADYVFSINISDQSIKLANCQLLIFVTTSVGNSYTVVNSAVTKDLKTTLPFEYNN